MSFENQGGFGVGAAGSMPCGSAEILAYGPARADIPYYDLYFQDEPLELYYTDEALDLT